MTTGRWGTPALQPEVAATRVERDVGDEDDERPGAVSPDSSASDGSRRLVPEQVGEVAGERPAALDEHVASGRRGAVRRPPSGASAAGAPAGTGSSRPSRTTRSSSARQRRFETPLALATDAERVERQGAVEPGEQACLVGASRR